MFPLVAIQSGLGKVLQLIVDHLPMRGSLYKNDRFPKIGDTLAMYTLADFSGYSGPQLIGPWTGPIWSDERSKLVAPALNWAHNGGPVDNFIYGAIWTALDGTLMFAQRHPKAPVPLTPANPTISYVPVLTDTAEYPG
jgi:hypothetical protein